MSFRSIKVSSCNENESRTVWLAGGGGGGGGWGWEGKQRWRGGETLASHQYASGSIPALNWYVGWVCCWFSSLLWGFFSGYSGFPSSTKINIPNSTWKQWMKEPLCEIHWNSHSQFPNSDLNSLRNQNFSFLTYRSCHASHKIQRLIVAPVVVSVLAPVSGFKH